MSRPIHIVDAFTDVPFRGNPAAICVLDEAADAAWMQDVAAEMNLSETAFVVPRPDAAFDLRWFTPGAEVDLCGHATLAAAHVLWEGGKLDGDAPAVFHTRSGELRASRAGDEIAMDFPALGTEAIAALPEIAKVLGADPIGWYAIVGRSPGRFLVEFASEGDVRALEPAFGDPSAWNGQPVIATARGEAAGFDFVSRFFAPSLGVPEDPVTGSAHCALTPFWSGRLGKDAMRALQVSPRTGVVGVCARGDRVELRGRACTIVEGRLL